MVFIADDLSAGSVSDGIEEDEGQEDEQEEAEEGVEEASEAADEAAVSPSFLKGDRPLGGAGAVGGHHEDQDHRQDEEAAATTYNEIKNKETDLRSLEQLNSASEVSSSATSPSILIYYDIKNHPSLEPPKPSTS